MIVFVRALLLLNSAVCTCTNQGASWGEVEFVSVVKGDSVVVVGSDKNEQNRTERGPLEPDVENGRGVRMGALMTSKHTSPPVRSCWLSVERLATQHPALVGAPHRHVAWCCCGVVDLGGCGLGLGLGNSERDRIRCVACTRPGW
jgi:hypothetical protein